MDCPYQYMLEIFDRSGSPLERMLLSVDFEPAEEWTRFMAVRHGDLASSNAGTQARVLPLWHPDLGQPYTDGFRVQIPTDASREFSRCFTTGYFGTQARAASSNLVKQGRLASDDTVRYLVAAFPKQAEANEPAGRRFEVERVAPDLPLREGTLADFIDAATRQGEDAPRDIPVFIPRFVLDEAATLAKRAGSNETGGILIGHLLRDATVPEIFVVITAQIFASQARGGSTRLKFTSETWAEVQTVLELRRRDELMVGWWHSHPVHEWCKQCPIERRRQCPMSSGFMSAHDRALHRAVFPCAYGMALVVNDIADDELTQSCFGWREGLLEAKHFLVLEESPEKILATQARSKR